MFSTSVNATRLRSPVTRMLRNYQSVETQIDIPILLQHIADQKMLFELMNQGDPTQTSAR
jgi:hypothetical protein